MAAIGSVSSTDRRSASKERRLDERIAAIRIKNQAIERRHEEVERDRKAAGTAEADNVSNKGSHVKPGGRLAGRLTFEKIRPVVSPPTGAAVRAWDRGKLPVERWMGNVPSVDFTPTITRNTGQHYHHNGHNPKSRAPRQHQQQPPQRLRREPKKGTSCDVPSSSTNSTSHGNSTASPPPPPPLAPSSANQSPVKRERQFDRRIRREEKATKTKLKPQEKVENDGDDAVACVLASLVDEVCKADDTTP